MTFLYVLLHFSGGIFGLTLLDFTELYAVEVFSPGKVKGDSYFSIYSSLSGLPSLQAEVLFIFNFNNQPIYDWLRF